MTIYQGRAALQPQVFLELSNVFHCVLNIVASTTERDALINGRRSWTELGWKAMSMKGFDVHKGRTIDYGNYEYRCFARVLCLADPRLNGQFARLSRFWPALHPDELDCDTVVDRQGDLVEILLAALRAEEYFFPWLQLSGPQVQGFPDVQRRMHRTGDSSETLRHDCT